MNIFQLFQHTAAGTSLQSFNVTEKFHGIPRMWGEISQASENSFQSQVGGWLRIVIVALPRLFYYHFNMPPDLHIRFLETTFKQNNIRYEILI